MMKIKFVCFILFIPFALFSQKTLQKKTDFGQGTITVGVYGHSATDSGMHDDENMLPIGYRNQVFHYTINGDCILRSNPGIHSQHFEELKDSGNKIQASMHISIFSPDYLIKYDSALLYLYSYENKKLAKIFSYGLDTFSYEYFYRHQFKDSTYIKVLPLDDNEKIIINNIPCYRGRAIELKTGYPVSFYYTKMPMKVRSPINEHINSNFPYNIIRIKFHVDWTERGMLTASGGYIIFQVENYKEEFVNPELFALPIGIPVIKNIPLMEVIDKYENG
jgi:hypothetical protein